MPLCAGKVRLFLVFGLLLWFPRCDARPPKTAVVLQGGGAKGAFQAGVLRALCGTEDANSWTLLTGTSIGALNAAYLAQFKPSEQCSLAVPALEREWRSINSSSDLMVRTGTKDKCELSSGIWVIGDLRYQNNGGFTCEMGPGMKLYARLIKVDRIRSSGMALGVPAVSLDTGLLRYFNETAAPEALFNGIVASGTLVPMVPPVVIAGERFMDGGVRANLPILQALERGAERVLAILLNPLQPGRPAQFPQSDQADQLKQRLLFLFDVFYDAEFTSDVREACFRYPSADIRAYVPREPLGHMLDFGHAALAERLERGTSGAGARLVRDLCTELKFPRGRGRTLAETLLLIASGAASAVVVLLAFRCTASFCRRPAAAKWQAGRQVSGGEDDLELCSTVGKASLE